MSDFPPPAQLLDHIVHRPYPIPNDPWLGTQSWHDLMFAHWPIARERLQAVMPAGLELDLFDGQSWLSVTPFRLTNLTARGLPAVPFVSAFNELNVRTYVRAGGRPGIFFFSLDASSTLAVAGARTIFQLPYYVASIDVTSTPSGVRYDCRRTTPGAKGAAFRAHCRVLEPVGPPVKGSLEYFLTERYCLFTVDSRYRAHRVDIHHPAWLLHRAETDIEVNTMAEAAGLELPEGVAPLIHFARRQDVLVWAPVEA
jgi:uncharacterized protein